MFHNWHVATTAIFHFVLFYLTDHVYVGLMGDADGAFRWEDGTDATALITAGHWKNDNPPQVIDGIAVCSRYGELKPVDPITPLKVLCIKPIS